MASIGIHTAAGKLLRSPFHPTNKSNQFICPNPNLSISNNAKKKPQQFQSASIAPSQQTLLSPHHQDDDELMELNSDSNTKGGDILGRIDYWVENSMTDIVKNLKQAPLLVQIYSELDGKIKVQTEKAVVDKWPLARDEWRSGESKSPDGLIFVEELEKESEGEGVTRAWGVVVQGKGCERGPACYLLKTDRVCAGLGLGFCTHFCLMRVKNFRDSALDQFKDSWLLQ